MVMARSPLVSVLLPVYNGERYLRESLDSVLQSFEFGCSWSMVGPQTDQEVIEAGQGRESCPRFRARAASGPLNARLAAYRVTGLPG
jgi:glycosyltransferase involved in cell wall biosynthesis